MDVHRARFINYPTPPISCLAFTRSNDTDLKTNKPTLRLALARTDGTIEIWNPLNGVWVQETIFRSSADNVVDSLLWTQEPDEVGLDGEIILGQYRLFSIGSSSNVTEWDLETGTIKRKSTGNFSEIWCFAAQPRSSKPSTIDTPVRTQDIVIGCGDGTLALLNTEDNDLQFRRFLARVSGKKARCLTATYQKPEVVVAGFADGMIRVFDTRNGSVLRTMSLGVGLPGAPKTTLIWKLTALPDGDLVSADSNGELRIWDGKTLSMSQRLHGHERDCLDVISSSDGKTLFSGGVDGRIACFKRTTGDQGRSSWSKVSHRKIHQGHGPVRTLAAYDGKAMSVFVAGGADPAPVVVPLKNFGKEHMRSLPFLPQEAQVVSAPSARIIATWWDNTIYIYRFARQNSLEVLRDAESALRQLVAKIQLDTTETIRSVALSPSGDLLAASTSTSTKLFQLRSASVEERALKVHKLALPKEIATSGARQLALAGEEAFWLAAVSSDNEIRLTRIIWSSSASDVLQAANMAIELERPNRRNTKQTGFKQYESTITKLIFSDNASVLVTGDLSGNLDHWEVDGDFDVDQSCITVSREAANEDTDSDSDSDDEDAEIVMYGQTWRPASNPLPRLESAPLLMTFRPSGEQNLIDSQLGDAVVPSHRRMLVVTARHQLYEFDLRQGRLSGWSQRNPSSSLPDDFTILRDRVIGAHWDPRERLWLYGSTFVTMLDVSDDISTTEQNGLAKRKREDEEDKSSSKRNKGSGAGGVITNGYSLIGPHTAIKTKQDKSTTVDLLGDMDMDDDEVIEPDSVQAGSNEMVLSHERTIQQWSTSKYRPILGMVALARGAVSSHEDEDVLEVVIVERPPISAKKKSRQKI